MEAFNEMSRKNNTGGRYVPDPRNPNFAVLECDSRGARNRELKLRGKFDKNAGFGDFAGS
jgi:hypothetical protein